MSASLLELEGNPMFGKEYPLTLDVAVLYYRTIKPRDAVDNKIQEPNLTSGNKAALNERDIRQAEKELNVKHQLLEGWSKNLDKGDAKLQEQKLALEKLQETPKKLEDLEQREKELEKEKCVEIHRLTQHYDKHSVELASLTGFMDHAEDPQKLIQARQLNLQEKSRSIETENRKFVSNNVEYLKEKGLYQLTTPEVGRLPCGEPIPINELERYIPGFVKNEIMKQNLEVGDQETKIVLQKYSCSYSVEIPNFDGEPVLITCCGSNKNEALKKLMDEIQKVLRGFVVGK